MRKQDVSVSIMIEHARRTGVAGELLECYRNYLRLLANTWLETSMQGKFDQSDLVQEALIKANGRFGQFRGRSEGELVAWLRQILANQLVDMVRRFSGAARDVKREVDVRQSLDASSQALDNFLAAGNTSPSQVAQGREMSVLLADVLATMKPEYSQVIILRNLRELSWAEISARTGRTEGALRMQWTRALKELRPLIERR